MRKPGLLLAALAGALVLASAASATIDEYYDGSCLLRLEMSGIATVSTRTAATSSTLRSRRPTGRTTQ